MRRVRALGWIVAVLMIPACGPGGHSSGGSSLSSGAPDLSTPGFDLSGGSASGPSSVGGDGGGLTVRATGAIQVTPDPAPAAPPLPAAPGGGNVISDLSDDRTLSGTSIVASALLSTGTTTVRSITVNGGDLVVSGSIQTSDREGLSLTASGTIFLAGTVRTNGGPATLRANRIVVTGSVSTDGTAGSGGGAITLTATDTLFVVGGSLSASGGSGSARGGAGGAVTLGSGGELRLHGTVTSNGGAAEGSGNDVQGGGAGAIRLAGAGLVVVDATLRFRGASARTTGVGAVGGDGGLLAIDGEVPVRLFGTWDGRGGAASASAAGAALRGGRGGRLSIGAATPVVSLAMQEARYVSDGGSGDASGGRGGTVDLLASSGGIALRGTFVAEGGGSGRTPGPGGTFHAECDFLGGDLTSSATLIVSGGSATSGASASAGGAGGRVDLLAYFDARRTPSGSGGSVLLSAESLIAADGGDSTGAETAGKGGTVHMEIPESHVSMAGTITARGGTALGSGKGGLGGLIWVDSDSNATTTGGNITLETGGVLNASGGDSAMGLGGDAQWSTTPGLFAAGRIPIAVLLDSDSVAGGPFPGGVILNKGVVFAQGGKPNGHGGDVEFHGASTTTREPEMGDVRNSGDGSGANGVFTSD